MSKREPLQDWLNEYQPAPKTTMAFWCEGEWVVARKGQVPTYMSAFNTWAEAWAAALELEGLT